MSPFVIESRGAWIRKARDPSTPAFVPRFAVLSNDSRNSGRQSGYPE
jgi:hypothetical protein